MTTTSLTDLPLYVEAGLPLDLLSISQKISEHCVYGSPYIAFQTAPRRWTVTRGWCHHWDCPRCGQQRAREEYGRIVEGCKTLDEKHEIYFITITCRGREMSVEEALEGYLKWTNRLLSSLRADARKRGVCWAYAQVTEWQKRGHPHSHILTTYHPADLTDGYKITTLHLAGGGTVTGCQDALRSEYLQKRVITAGLGDQYDISQVVTVEGASRYVAKYLFKKSMFNAEYPSHWRRVRYSQSFPKLPDRGGSGFAILSREDWRLLAQKAAIVDCVGSIAASEARFNLRSADVVVLQRPEISKIIKRKID